MNAAFSLFTGLAGVIALAAIAALGVGVIGLDSLFGIVVPYVAMVLFAGGVIYRVLDWAKVPVPFRITTTCGQGYSLPFLPRNKFDAPFFTSEVIVRMLLEVFLFRSLFRNTNTELREGPRLTYGSVQWLWLAGIVFHYSFLIIAIRHFRFFLDPVPSFIETLSAVDGFFQMAVPTLFLTDIALLAAVTYLFLRRVVLPQVRYISLPADFFPLFLILGIGITGVLMRNVWKVDLLGVKTLAMGLFTLHPTMPPGIGTIFYVHLFLVCCLFAYLPFSKIMHAAGVLMSPTRNMASNNRAVRHVNPWEAELKKSKVHTYEEYEDDFRAKMKEAGIPVDKE
jgi:nitrate reductase gamma subunit